MKKERYQEIIDEAYENYNKLMKNSEWRYDNKLKLEWFTRDHESELHMQAGPAYRPLSKEEFISKCKTDSEFAERWGLKIEERELNTVAERKRYDRYYDDLIGESKEHHDTLDKRGVPRKIATVTYKEETIEVYE